MLPLSLLGSMVLEIEIGGYDDCFTTGTNITNLWAIQRPVIFADVITVDPSLTNSFASHLLSGKELPITFDGFFSSITSVATVDSSSGASSAVTIPIYRGFSRIKAIHVSFLPTACLSIRGSRALSWATRFRLRRTTSSEPTSNTERRAILFTRSSLFRSASTATGRRR